MGLLPNKVGVLVMEDTVKAELQNAFFASVFTDNAGPQASQFLEVKNKPVERKTFPCLRSIT